VKGERLTPIREIKPSTGHLLQETNKASTPSIKEPLLEVKGLTKRFKSRRSLGAEQKTFLAVDDVSFSIGRGECLGLVGESGCGKSTTSKMIMSALKPDEGQVLFGDQGTQVDLSNLRSKELFPFRRRMQYVFQDPFSALNPRMTVRE
ncbi:MAG: ATP-binding cassette domain-containing protein, partial [Opitutae bacterium]